MVQNGQTRIVPIPTDVNTHTLKDLISFPRGHRVYVITILNPGGTDRNGKNASAGTCWAGADGNPDMPLPIGFANDWFYVDPGSFALAGGNVAGVNPVVDISGCVEECPECKKG